MAKVLTDIDPIFTKTQAQANIDTCTRMLITVIPLFDKILTKDTNDQIWVLTCAIV